MANSRVIASAIWDDEWFGPLGFFEQALWIGLWSKCADDQGRLLDNAVLMRAAIFPYKDIGADVFNTALEDFERSGRIYRYEADGKRLIQVLHWWEHQPQQWASASKWPAPDGWIDHVRTRANNEYSSANWHNKDGNAADNANWQPPEMRDADAVQVNVQVNARDGAQVGGHIPVPVPIPSRDNGVAAAPPPATPRQPSAKDRDRKALEDHFVAVTGLPSPKQDSESDRRAAGSLWWKPLRIILAELAKDDVTTAKRLIDQAVAQLRTGGCTIADPNSILKTARAINAESRASPRTPPPIVGWRSPLTGESSSGTS